MRRLYNPGMQLVHDLERLAEGEESLFRRQLLREDVARLRKLEALAASAPDFPSFAKTGMRLGWTQGDARTGELREPLERLLAEVYDVKKGTGDEARLVQAWNELHRTRMERLLGCLSTPVPKPTE